MVVILRDKFILELMSTWYRSNRPVCMSPHPCVNELPLRVYRVHRIFTAMEI